MTRTITLTDAGAHILAALLQHHADNTAPEDTMALLQEVMPDSGGHDFDDRLEQWGRLCTAIKRAVPPVAGA